VPFVALSGGVSVDGNEDDAVLAQESADFIDTAAALRQRDIGLFRHEKLGIVAEVGQGGSDTGGNLPVPGVFPKDAIGAALAYVGEMSKFAQINCNLMIWWFSSVEIVLFK